MGELLDHYILEFCVTTSVYERFMELFKDKNPMHANQAYAIRHGFPDVIMHGNILCGYLSYFVGECLGQKNVIILSQTIDFHKPFFKDDKLTFKARRITFSEAVGLSEYKFIFRNKENERIAKGSIQIKNL